jgi:hypothetical protein
MNPLEFMTFRRVAWNGGVMIAGSNANMLHNQEILPLCDYGVVDAYMGDRSTEI